MFSICVEDEHTREKGERTTENKKERRDMNSTGLHAGEEIVRVTGLNAGEEIVRVTGLNAGKEIVGATGLNVGEETVRATGLNAGEEIVRATGLNAGEEIVRVTWSRNVISDTGESATLYGGKSPRQKKVYLFSLLLCLILCEDDVHQFAVRHVLHAVTGRTHFLVHLVATTQAATYQNSSKLQSVVPALGEPIA